LISRIFQNPLKIQPLSQYFLLARILNITLRDSPTHKECAMAEQTLTLGERICLVARLAVEEHLLQSVTQMDSTRRIMIGGADSDRVTDDHVPFARGRAEIAAGLRLAEGEVG
jgi:hypothetical protein